MERRRARTLRTVYRRDRAQALNELARAQEQADELTVALDQVAQAIEQLKLEATELKPGQTVNAGRLDHQYRDQSIRESELAALVEKQQRLTDRMDAKRTEMMALREAAARATKALKALDDQTP